MIDYKTITWDIFEQEFGELTNIEKSVKKNIFIYLENNIAPQKWSKFEEIKDYDDLELFKRLAVVEHFKHGDNIVISDVSFDDGYGPFIVDGAILEDFIMKHRENFKRRLFCGLDLAIINISERYVFVYHHEDYYVNIKLPVDK